MIELTKRQKLQLCADENRLQVISELKKLKFDSLSPANKRRVIARDALEQIRVGKAIPTSGRYIEILSTKGIKGSTLVNEVTSKIKCSVCGLGSLALAHIDKFNTCKLTIESDGLSDQDELYKELRGVFSKKQLRMVEAAFEQSLNYTGAVGKDLRASMEYGSDMSRDDANRLTTILENIVENGKFKVPRKYY